MAERRIVYVAFSNTDLNEGRGHDIPIATCEMEVTARRLARHKYIQGSDGPVRAVELLLHDGHWYLPIWAMNIIKPSVEDQRLAAVDEARSAALKKALDAGLSDEDIKALAGRPQTSSPNGKEE